MKRYFQSAGHIAAASLLLISLAYAQKPLVEGITGVSITVSDMDRAVDFYSRVLSFQKISDQEFAGEKYEHLEGIFGLRVRLVRMRLGDESIELAEYLAPKGRPIPAGLHSNDRSFQHIAIIVSDMDAAYKILRQNKAEHASSGPQRLPDWNKNAGGIKAFYFKDPDGHPLEILQFPADKGLAKWHQSGGKLFLGIDHTAIVVSDTDASLHFYRDLLGLRVAGESENYGTEQEHLNNVFGARLRITALRGAQGPGIELLEYLSPRDGAVFPADEHANDVLHRETILESSDARQVAAVLAKAHASFISPGVVEGAGDMAQAVTARDPDGHALRIETLGTSKPTEGVQYMQFKDHPGSASADPQAEQNHNQNPPSEAEVRLSRATMVEAVSHKLTSLFTAIIGNVELAFMALGEENLATPNLHAIKKATYTAQGWNAKLLSLMEECRREAGA
jgi:catechol 2,3-dioxygenase-like lactoylglutathione lyase family enzyme